MSRLGISRFGIRSGNNKSLFIIVAYVIIMVSRDVARLTSAVSTCVWANWCPRENAHRWRRFSTASHGRCFCMSRSVLSPSSCRRATLKGVVAECILELVVPSGADVLPPLRRSIYSLLRVHRHIKITNSLCKRTSGLHSNHRLYRHV